MAANNLRVLGIRSKGSGFALLFEHLAHLGCICDLAESYEDGVKRFKERSFDIVLCSGEPGIKTLFTAAEGSSASVYCAHLVENGWWWFPAVRNGKKCLGEPALQSSEFAEMLARMLEGPYLAASAGSS